MYFVCVCFFNDDDHDDDGLLFRVKYYIREYMYLCVQKNI